MFFLILSAWYLALSFLSLFLNVGVLSSPSVNLCLGASAWLLVDSDDLTSLRTSDDSILDDQFLSLSFDEPSSDLNPPESLIHLLAATGLSSNNYFLGFFAGLPSVVPDFVLLVYRLDLLSGLDSPDSVVLNPDIQKSGFPFLNFLLGAWARLVVDDDLSGLLANSESVSVDGDSVVDPVGSDLEGDSVGSSSIGSKSVSPLSDL